MLSPRRALVALVALPLAAAPLASCAVGVNPVTGARRAYAWTWQQEIEVGRSADREIVEQFGMVDDPNLAAWVTRVGEQVLAVSHLRRPGALDEYRETRFTFRVLDTEEVNAFALPGGYIYVTRGLLAHLDSEAQLAVVLGHEVAHVAGRHSSKDALRAGIVQLGIEGVAELGGIGRGIAEVGGTGIQLLLLRHGRDDERESDRLGVEYATLAGYDAAEGAHFFAALRRMGSREGWFPSFLSTHPDPGRREETVRRLAAEHAARVGGTLRVGRDAYLSRIDGLVLGEDPRYGYVENGVFHHPAGRFSVPVPAGWSMEREGREVQFAPRAGTLVVMLHPRVRFGSAAEAAAAFLEEQELTEVRSSTPDHGSVTARRIDANGTGEDGPYRVAALWLEQGGAVRRLVGLAAPADRRTMEYALSTMAFGLRRLTDPRLLNVSPSYLEVVTTRREGTFRSTVGSRRLPDGVDLEALAILNGVEVEGRIPAGTRLKLPR
jgi:predicted Zn-dependent protease